MSRFMALLFAGAVLASASPGPASAEKKKDDRDYEKSEYVSPGQRMGAPYRFNGKGEPLRTEKDEKKKGKEEKPKAKPKKKVKWASQPGKRRPGGGKVKSLEGDSDGSDGEAAASDDAPIGKSARKSGAKGGDKPRLKSGGGAEEEGAGDGKEQEGRGADTGDGGSKLGGGEDGGESSGGEPPAAAEPPPDEDSGGGAPPAADSGGGGVEYGGGAPEPGSE